MKKLITLSLCVLSLSIALTQCKPQRDFKGAGVITSIQQSDISVNSLIPDPLRKSIRDCTLRTLTEQELNCKETNGELAYLHTVKTKEVKDKSSLQLGNTLSLKLPLLKSYSIYVNKQYLQMSPYELEQGLTVFLDGKYLDQGVKITKVYKMEDSPVRTLTASNVVKLCVSGNSTDSNGDLTFQFYRQEGDTVAIYDLMHPNVQTDKANSSEILLEPGKKVLTMNLEMTEVMGIDTVEDSKLCINSSDTVIPPYKSKSTYKELTRSETNQSVNRNDSRREQSSKSKSSGISIGNILYWFVVFIIMIIILLYLEIYLNGY